MQIFCIKPRGISVNKINNNIQSFLNVKIVNELKCKQKPLKVATLSPLHFLLYRNDHKDKCGKRFSKNKFSGKNITIYEPAGVFMPTLYIAGSLV